MTRHELFVLVGSCALNDGAPASMGHKKAKPSAKRFLLYALEMRDRATVCKEDHRRYKQTTKIELLTIQSKAPRVYQASLPSRTLVLAPFWSAWQQAMKAHAFSVKGLSPNARAGRRLAEIRMGCAWRLKRTYQRCIVESDRDIVREVDKFLLGDQYAKHAQLHIQSTCCHFEFRQDVDGGLSPIW